MVSQETLAECHTAGNSGVRTRGRHVTAFLHLSCSAPESVRIWNIRIGFAVCLTQTDSYQPNEKALAIQNVPNDLLPSGSRSAPIASVSTIRSVSCEVFGHY